MKQNPNTRNIFTKQGRLNRLVDKYNKTLQLIDKMNKILERLDNKWDSIEIPLEKINKEVYGTEEVNECVIRCDGCGHEFNIFDKTIEKTEIDKTTEDGSPCIIETFTCPKCGFKNEIEFDNDDEDCECCNDKLSDEEKDIIEMTRIFNESQNSQEAEESTEEVETEDPIIAKYEDLYNDNNSSNKEKIIKRKSKEITIKNKGNKSHKVVIRNNNKPIKFIHDEKIINSIDSIMNHKSMSETISMLKVTGIDSIVSNDDNVIIYSTNTGTISFMCNKENKECIESVIINTELILVPHGNPINLYNAILKQLNIEKINNTFESIDLDGKACIVKLNNDEVAACNFNVDGKNLSMVFIYNIDKE